MIIKYPASILIYPASKMSGLVRAGGENNDMTAQIKPGIKELSHETGAPAARGCL